MRDWKMTTIAECSTILGDGLHGTPKYDENGEYAFINGNNLHNGRIVIKPDTKRVGLSEYEKHKKELTDRTILVSINGTLGNVAVYNGEKVILGKSACYFNVSSDCDVQFMRYVASSPCFQQYINSVATGTTIKNVSLKQMREYSFLIPELEEQQRIANVLHLLDQKIENNQKINDNLQQQAQTLFKEWFIDNPDAESWEKGTFSDLIEKTISGDWGKDAPSGNNTEMVYCIRGADIPEVRAGNKGKMPTRYILPKNYTSKQLVDGDIVVEISGGSPTQSTGRAAAISTTLLERYDKGMVCTNFCKAIKPIIGYSMYVYHYWLYLYDMGVFFSYENGTTGIKNLDIGGFVATEPITIAPADLVGKFDIFCQSVFSKVYANGLENEHLALVRDTLLPKLMTGEIDVSEIQL